MELKITMEDFQQQNTQDVRDKQYHTSSQNDHYNLRLKSIKLEYYYLINY